MSNICVDVCILPGKENIHSQMSENFWSSWCTSKLPPNRWPILSDHTSVSHIVQVFSGSPAEGELQRGDILLAINNTDASGLSHIAAEQQIKSAGGELQLRIKR